MCLFPQSVDGSVAVITGGGGVFGRILAEKLSALGAVIVTIDEKANEETKR